MPPVRAPIGAMNRTKHVRSARPTATFV
jgi:hypothetical protein